MRWTALWITSIVMILGLVAPGVSQTAFVLDSETESRLSAFDQGRIERRESALERAMAQARGGGADPAELAQVEGLLAAPSQAIAPDALLGDWRCRTIKIGGLLPLIVYRDFACRITRRDEGLFFEKRTGSQRTTGVLSPVEEAAMLYVGAGHYGHESPRSYGETPQEGGPTRDHVGVLRMIGPGEAMIGLPEPVFESIYDILHLRR